MLANWDFKISEILNETSVPSIKKHSMSSIIHHYEASFIHSSRISLSFGLMDVIWS